MTRNEIATLTDTPIKPEIPLIVDTELLEFKRKIHMVTMLPTTDKELPVIELPLIAELGFFDIQELTKFTD